MKHHLLLYFIMMCLISACGSTPTKVALQPSATPSAVTKTSTATATRRPIPITAPTEPRVRAKEAATATSFPTTTPISLPTKQIFMQFGIFGGDGGWPSDAYFGRDTPQWVLYTDGQLLVRKSDEKGDWFAETMLTVPQMCSLLSRVKSTGLFQIQGDGNSENDPIYTYTGTTPLGDGGADYIIQVNGQRHKLINIFKYYVSYLNPQAKAAFNLFSKYVPPATLMPYQAQYALLWIEKGKGNLAYATPAPTVQAWPTDVPSLDNLYEQNIQTSWPVDESYNLEVSQVLLQGKDAQSILSLFNNHLTSKLFSTNNGDLFVIARPLLPHEAPMSLSAYPYDAVEFDLPFNCDK